MRFEDEPYVRLYTRRTVTRRVWPWQARALLGELTCVLDRAGLLDLDGHDPAEAVAAVTDLPIDVVRPGLAAMIDSGTIVVSGDVLVMPKYVEAQTAHQSSTARSREHRARRRDLARARALGVEMECNATGQDGTDGDTEGHDATPRDAGGDAALHDGTQRCETGHEGTQVGTPSLAEQSIAEQSSSRDVDRGDAESRRPTRVPVLDPLAAAHDADVAEVLRTEPPRQCRRWGPSDAAEIHRQIRAFGLEHVQAVVAFVREAVEERRVFDDVETAPKAWSYLWRYDGEPWARWDQRYAESQAQPEPEAEHPERYVIRDGVHWRVRGPYWAAAMPSWEVEEVLAAGHVFEEETTDV